MTEFLFVGGELSNGEITNYLIAVSRADPSSSELSYVQSVSLDGNEIQSDELSVTLRHQQSPAQFLALFADVNSATPVWYDRTDDDGNRRLEKYYWKSLKRVGTYDYELTAQSPVGRLTSAFEGDLYAGQTLPDVITSVIGNVVPFTADERLNAVRVYGWLPYQSRRESLHALAFAYGFLIRRNDDCDLFFTLPGDTPSELPDNVIYHGGAVDYRTGQTYAKIDVTQYAFLKTGNDREITLFDNTDGCDAAVEQVVRFDDAPVYDVTASSGLTLHGYGVNHAVVSGVGLLTGKPYAKMTSVLSMDGDSNAEPDRVLTVDNMTLVTDLNAETVAAKYLSSANAPAVITMDFLRRAESPGDLLSFADPYGDARSAYLLSMSGNVSSVDRVSAQFLAGYVHHWGNAYTSVRVLTGSGTWTVPNDLDGHSIRVALIGGGQGGASGQHGSDDNGVGGVKGIPGNGGAVYVVKLSVRAGQTFAYSAGPGGAGGTHTSQTTESPSDTMTVYVAPTGDRWHLKKNCGNGSFSPVTYAVARQRGLTPCENCAKADNRFYYLSNPGDDGTASTFGVYSSASGAVPASGYRDIINGVSYAVTGPDNGVDGGSATSADENGNQSAPAYTDIVRPAVALPWDESQSWTSGAVGAGAYASQNGGEFVEWAYGGLGGGAAVGSNGVDGASVGQFADTGGRGGNGANASAVFPDDARTYGTGGSGGHGGGEGGRGGSGHSTESPANSASDGVNGVGGDGSSGQPGKDGCILIFFHKSENASPYGDVVESGDGWTLYDSGTLVISGDGPMNNYNTQEPPPWKPFKNDVEAVVIEDGVSSIGHSAFAYFTSLSSVTIPDSVTSIGVGAFQGCAALENVVIPDSVTSIGMYAFSSSGLLSVTIPNGVTIVQQSAFMTCYHLESVIIPVSVINIAKFAFDTCPSLTDVYYAGSETQWNGIYIGNNNHRLVNATKHYNSAGPAAE